MNLWNVAIAHNRVAVEVRFLHLAIFDGDSFLGRQPEPTDHAALSLGDDVVGLHRYSLIDRHPEIGHANLSVLRCTETSATQAMPLPLEPFALVDEFPEFALAQFIRPR
jgi:hypothetical protein